MASRGEGPARSARADDPSGAGTPDDAAALSALPFEQAVSELEAIVQRMESGSLSLEDSLDAYRRGAALVARCRRALADAQQQVRVLEGEMLKPFDVDEEAGGSAQ